MPNQIKIRRVKSDARRSVSGLIARVFETLPQSVWIEPDTFARRIIFPRWFGLFYDSAMNGGVVEAAYDDPQIVGAAIWLPVQPDTGHSDLYDQQLAKITGANYARYREFDETLARNHPTVLPTAGGTRPVPAHLHLTMLAVDPGWQGQGIGSALLDERHAVLDARRFPAYLEASTERSRELYLRHGYVDIGQPFHLPNDGPPMWPMWRESKS